MNQGVKAVASGSPDAVSELPSTWNPDTVPGTGRLWAEETGEVKQPLSASSVLVMMLELAFQMETGSRRDSYAPVFMATSLKTAKTGKQSKCRPTMSGYRKWRDR